MKTKRDVDGLHLKDILYRDDIPEMCVLDCTHPGPCDDDVKFWVDRLGFTVNQMRARAYLKTLDAWDETEISRMDDDDVCERILWIACGDFKEGSDIFVME